MLCVNWLLKGSILKPHGIPENCLSGLLISAQIEKGVSGVWGLQQKSIYGFGGNSSTSSTWIEEEESAPHNINL